MYNIFVIFSMVFPATTSIILGRKKLRLWHDGLGRRMAGAYRRCPPLGVRGTREAAPVRMQLRK